MRRTRRVARDAAVHVACAVIGLTGGYYAVLIVADWIGHV